MKLKRLATFAVVMFAAMAVTAGYASAATAKIRQVAGLGMGLNNPGQSATVGPLLSSGTAASESSWTRKAKSEGVQTVRVSVGWADIAPTKPSDPTDPASAAYNWAALDPTVIALHSEGFAVELVVSEAPSWAEGSGKPSYAAAGTWKPNATDLGQFAQALATRYDGKYANPADPGTVLPKVSSYEPWNEPNLSSNLAPQWSNATGSNCTAKFKGKTLESAALYRGMQNAFYAGVKKAAASDTVAMAGLAPYADPQCSLNVGLKTYRSSPVPFLRALFCLNSSDKHQSGCNTATHLDALNIHPYPPPDSHVGVTWTDAPAGDTPIADVHELSTVLNAAKKVHMVTTSKKTPIGFWATEVAWDTNAPDKGGVSDATAANWMNQGFYLLWNQGVRTIDWYRLADISKFSGEDWPGGSGLFTAAGKAKTMATAFRFLFVTHRTGKNTVVAWGRTPVSGTLKVERKSGKRWITVASGHAGSHEVFEATIKSSGSTTYRAQVGSQTSLNWSQTKGTW